MAVRRITLEKYLIEARRIAAHRTEEAEKGIRRTYKKVLKEMQHFLADEYVKYAKNDSLTYAMLQQQNEYANFMDTIQKKVDDILPTVQREIKRVVEETYRNAYNGMIKAVETANTAEELHINLKGIEACRPEVIKRAVENPVSGLTLKDRLEKNRKNVVYDIKQQIGVGLANGDRYTTMAERVSECLDGDYQKAVRVVRTETHRVEEAGNLDASLAMEEELNLAGMATTKTWVTMDDVRVRHGKKANHVKMEGKTIPINEMFDLGRGIKTMSPGNSGDAANDIHCRCFLAYDLEELSDIEKSLEEQINEDGYDWLNDDDYDNLVEEHKKSITQEEKNQIYAQDWDEWKPLNVENGYINSENSFEINKAIRNDTVSALNTESQKTISVLESCIERNVLNKKVLSTRYLDENWLNDKIANQDNVNGIIQTLNIMAKKNILIREKQFVSSSLNKNNVYDDKAIKLIIENPQGTKAFITENRMESEIILHSPTYQIKKAEINKKNQICILVEVIV